MVTRLIHSKTYTVHTNLLFDPSSKSFARNLSLVIEPSSGNIVKVYTRSAEPQSISPPDIDLRHLTVLPGLVDSHTHIFLHSYADTPALYQMRDESPTERTIRATLHCRAALSAGYTTYRDLGTEGMGDADIHVRDAINRGIMPGPRIFCATECLASSGSYEVRVEAGTTGRICDPCDGPEEVRAAVRRRIGAGADIVKVYADYRRRAARFPKPTWPGCPGLLHPPDGGEEDPLSTKSTSCLFSQEEMDAAVQEAKRAKAPIAAHAASPEAVIMAANAGVTTVEHGYLPSDEALAAMKKNNVIFVPTLAVLETVGQPSRIFEQTKAAYKAGVKIAAGGDTGAFDHGENVRELELLLDAGLPIEEVLLSATLRGWEACGGDLCGRRFGCIKEGWAADLVALRGDPREDRSSLRKVDFVMKDGVVWKRDGKTRFDE